MVKVTVMMDQMRKAVLPQTPPLQKLFPSQSSVQRVCSVVTVVSVSDLTRNVMGVVIVRIILMRLIVVVRVEISSVMMAAASMADSNVMGFLIVRTRLMKQDVPHAPVALGILPAEMASVLMLLPGVIKHLTVLTDPMRKDAPVRRMSSHAQMVDASRPAGAATVR